MITERVGDLLTEPDLTHVAHQCNLYHAFGAGLARAIAKKWPRAAAADRATAYGAPGKLGTFSLSLGAPTVVNIYSQRGPEDGFAECLTDYEALGKALNRLTQELYAAQGLGQAVRLGLPYRLGCGLAGGRWPKVYGMVEKIFGPAPLDVVIVRRPEDA